MNQSSPDTGTDARARVAYETFLGGIHPPSTLPSWLTAPSWVRDVARVAYLQGKLDGAIPAFTTALLREPTQAMLEAARDWSRTKYGKPIGSDAATGCWQTMLDAVTSTVPPAQQAAQKPKFADDERPLPTYEQIPWAQLGRDVNDAIYAIRKDYDFDPSYYPGHQMVPQINFNSLARIVDKYRYYGIGPLPSTEPSSFCEHCDLEHRLHEDAQGFHHVIKGERVPCGMN